MVKTRRARAASFSSDYESEEEQVREVVPAVHEDCERLCALVAFYNSLPDKNTPYAASILGKCQRVADRLEPSEVGDAGDLDQVVNMTDRIRLLRPGRTIEREDLFEIGQRAKELHIEVYDTPPRRIRRKLQDGERFINVYTEETAPKTLDVAIKEHWV